MAENPRQLLQAIRPRRHRRSQHGDRRCTAGGHFGPLAAGESRTDRRGRPIAGIQRRSRTRLVPLRWSRFSRGLPRDESFRQIDQFLRRLDLVFAQQASAVALEVSDGARSVALGGQGFHVNTDRVLLIGIKTFDGTREVAAIACCQDADPQEPQHVMHECLGLPLPLHQEPIVERRIVGLRAGQQGQIRQGQQIATFADLARAQMHLEMRQVGSQPLAVDPDGLPVGVKKGNACDVLQAAEFGNAVPQRIVGLLDAAFTP
jgi:hypothetical protein